MATGGALFVAVAEIVFFAEFDGRFNFVAVDYLIYPTEVVNNIWESYPTGWIVAAIASSRPPWCTVAPPNSHGDRRGGASAADSRIALAYVVVLLRLLEPRAPWPRPRLG